MKTVLIFKNLKQNIVIQTFIGILVYVFEFLKKKVLEKYQFFRRIVRFFVNCTSIFGRRKNLETNNRYDHTICKNFG